MQQSAELPRGTSAGPFAPGLDVALYVYCVVPRGEAADLAEEGIEGRPVYTLGHGDIAALVHACPPQPYGSSAGEGAAAWVLAHHRVVEAAWKRLGSALPMAFNTIVIGSEDRSAEDSLKVWLETEYDALRRKLAAFQGKAEYAFQVFWDPAMVAREVAQASPEIGRWEEESSAKPAGLAYMWRQRLERVLRQAVEARAAALFQELYCRLGRCADRIQVDKARAAAPDRQMIINLSCLMAVERYPDLRALADEVGEREGYFVRLVGPLPPYSFC